MTGHLIFLCFLEDSLELIKVYHSALLDVVFGDDFFDDTVGHTLAQLLEGELDVVLSYEAGLVRVEH